MFQVLNFFCVNHEKGKYSLLFNSLHNRGFGTVHLNKILEIDK